MSGWRELILVIVADGEAGTCQVEHVLDSPKAAGTASGPRGAGTLDAQPSCLHFTLIASNNRENGSVGNLSVLRDLPSADLATPRALQHILGGPGIETLYDNGVIRQVKSSLGLADIVVLVDFAYTVDFCVEGERAIGTRAFANTLKMERGRYRVKRGRPVQSVRIRV